MSASPIPCTRMKYVILREGLLTTGSVYYGEVYYEDGSVLALEMHKDIEAAARQSCEVANGGECQIRLCLIPRRRT